MLCSERTEAGVFPGTSEDMGSKLFVGGLSWNTTDETLRVAFEAFGGVREARVILDRDTGRSRGFGFVTYEKDEDAQTGMTQMNDAMLDGRTIRVNEAEDRRGGRGGAPGGSRGPPRDRPDVTVRGRPGGYQSGGPGGPPRGPGGPPRGPGGPPRGPGLRGPPRGPGGPPRGPGGPPRGPGGPPRGPGGGGHRGPPRSGQGGPPGANDPPESWDDRERKAERKTPKKRKGQEEDFRLKNAAPRREKRQSGRSWRDYQMDDEVGEWDGEDE